MIAYTRSLQYWTEKQNLPRSQNFHPLAESVIELWEAVKEYVTFDHWDIVQGLGMTHIESPNQEPHATIFSHMLLSPNKEQESRRTTSYATSPITERNMAKSATSPARTGRENPCLLFITASVAWINWGLGGNTTGRSTSVGDAFQNLQMVATFAVPCRAVCYGDATIKEMDR